MRLEIYALLYIGDGECASSVNARFGSAREKVASFTSQAVQLHRTLKAFHGVALTLVTNEPRHLAERLQNVPASHRPRIRRGVFRKRLGPDARFSEAYHKLDMLEMLGEPSSDRSTYRLLLDLDVCCLREPSPGLERLHDDQIAGLYEITDQVIPAYGFEAIESDLRTVLGSRRIAANRIRWFGGEFIAGPPGFFQQLSKRIEVLWPAYRVSYRKLHHQGDETLLSAAMADCSSSREIADAGRLGIVSRHWTVPTKHPAHSLARSMRADFLHLPSSKALLAANASRNNPVVRVRQLAAREFALQVRGFLGTMLGRPPGPPRR